MIVAQLVSPSVALPAELVLSNIEVILESLDSILDSLKFDAILTFS